MIIISQYTSIKKLSKNHKKAQEVEIENQNLKRKLEDLEKREKTFNNEVMRLKTLSENRNKMIINLNGELEDVKADRNTTQRRLHAIEHGNHYIQMDIITTEAEEKQRTIMELKQLIKQKKHESKVEVERRDKKIRTLIAEIQQKDKKIQDLVTEIQQKERRTQDLIAEIEAHKCNLPKLLDSNLSAMPWLAGMIADFITYDFEIEAKKLDWGRNVKRANKVASIRDIRQEANRRIQKSKEAVYQLEYIRALFPGIDDVLACDYREIQYDGNIPDHDPILDYLTKEEWRQLPEDKKNQLALDRYIASRKKSKWQIGRDYELSVAHEYMRQGYKVDTFGAYMGIKDLGRDLIAKKGQVVHIVQCKYWSQSKKIHEKHIYQLYGTMIGYCVEHNAPFDEVEGVFVTNIELSDMARRVAKYLGLIYLENHQMIDFPRIKCNIGHDENGNKTKIYHLPMDQQYDVTKIEKSGEFYAFLVKEAMNAGFRRAFKWHGDK